MELEQLDITTISTIQASYRFPCIARILDELIYNSLQAMADYIEIHLTLPSLIEIRDNGKALDLEKLSSFMTESHNSSLYFISKLATLTIISKTHHNPCYKLTLQSPLPKHSSALLKPGTVIRLEDLYSCIPVRKYEISTPDSTVSSIKDVMYKYSLMHHDTEFKLYSNSEVISCYSICKDFMSRIQQCIPHNLKEISYSGKTISIRGFISDVFSCIPHSKEQHFYINNRPITSKLLQDTIHTAFKEVLSSVMVQDGEKHRYKYPVYVLDIHIEGEFEILPDGERLELNIVDQYRTIQEIYTCLEEFLNVKLTRKLSSLEKTEKKNLNLSLDFKSYRFCSDIDDEELIRKCDQQLELHKAKKLKTEKKDYSQLITQNLLKKPKVLSTKSPAKSNLGPLKSVADILPSSLRDYKEETGLEFSVPDYILQTSTMITVSNLHGCRVIGQVKNEFITAITSDDTLIIVDQHAAHERIRLEKFEKEVESHITSHPCDEFLGLSDRESVLIKNSESYIKRWHFEYRHIRNGIQLTKLPKIFDTVLQPYDILLLCEARDSIPEPIHRILKSKACKGAIKFGDRISFQESTRIMQELCECNQPFFCAHGRPSIHAVQRGLLRSVELPYPKLINKIC